MALKYKVISFEYDQNHFSKEFLSLIKKKILKANLSHHRAIQQGKSIKTLSQWLRKKKSLISVALMEAARLSEDRNSLNDQFEYLNQAEHKLKKGTCKRSQDNQS